MAVPHFPNELAAFQDIQSPEFQRSLISGILLSSPNGILVVNHEGQVVFHNPQFFKVWGLSPSDKQAHAIGEADTPLLAKVTTLVKDPDAFLARIQALYAHHDQLDDCEIALKDGRTLDRHSGPLLGEHGEYHGRVWFFRDITERKLAENRLRESESRFRQMFEFNDAVMLLIDPESGQIIDANRAASRFYGYPIERLRNMNIQEINLLSPGEVAKARQHVRRQEKSCFIFPHRLANGEHRTVEVHSSPVLVEERTLLFSIIHDITRQHQAEQELKIAAIAFDSQEGMFVTDAETRILRVNKAFTDITGYAPEDVIGKTPRLLGSGRHEKGFYDAMWVQISRDDKWQGEIWNRRKSGEIFPEWLTVTAVRNDAGKVTHYVATLMDISLRKATEEAISQMAFHDVLTHLPNRRMLSDRLTQAMAISKRSHRYGAVLFMDLDNFKPLNDTHGHIMGDLLLIEVAQRLKTCVRETDTISRFGGDEFVVLLSELGAHREKAAQLALTIAEKIRTALAQPYRLLHDPLTSPVTHHCTASIGLALFRGTEVPMDDILIRADNAMYQAKRGGRNRIHLQAPNPFTPGQ